MLDMRREQVTSIEAARTNRVARAIDAHRRIRAAAAPRPARPGRAWINGVETASPDPALVHLAQSYD